MVCFHKKSLSLTCRWQILLPYMPYTMCMCILDVYLSFYGSIHIGLGIRAYQWDLTYSNYIFKGSVSKCCLLLEHWERRYQHINFGVTQFSQK